MKNHHRIKLLTSALLLALSAPLLAQDLLITNGRVLDGKGGVIDKGSVLIRAGKIESVTAGTQTANGVKVIDAGGKTIMPGLVEGHRHVIQGNPGTWLAERAPKQMQEFLDAGFTTVLSAIDAALFCPW